METAGKNPRRRAFDAMKETGLGTPATRASIIEVLLNASTFTRSGQELGTTDKGVRLIEVVHPEVKSPIMTAMGNSTSSNSPRNGTARSLSVKGIEDYVRDVVGKVGQVPAAPRTNAGEGDRAPLEQRHHLDSESTAFRLPKPARGATQLQAR